MALSLSTAHCDQGLRPAQGIVVLRMAAYDIAIVEQLQLLLHSQQGCGCRWDLQAYRQSIAATPEWQHHAQPI